MEDIKGFDDVKVLVDCFYQNVLNDDLLAPVFSKHLVGKWDEHHEKLYRFWQTVLFKEMMYYGRPQHTHEKLELTQAHFDHWVSTWHKTVDLLFSGKVAERAKYRGKTMADSFFKRLDK